MAKFKYLGENPKSFVKSYGKCTEIKLPRKIGGAMILKPIAPLDHFEIGKDIGYDIDEEMALMCLRADSRFEEIK